MSRPGNTTRSYPHLRVSSKRRVGLQTNRIECRYLSTLGMNLWGLIGLQNSFILRNVNVVSSRGREQSWAIPASTEDVYSNFDVAATIPEIVNREVGGGRKGPRYPQPRLVTTRLNLICIQATKGVHSHLSHFITSVTGVKDDSCQTNRV